ncbi:hypothetical protein BDV95DRAFT_601602 [Massariosphaeria phaeospora]|uniref:Uncharacterized protein n=1 Tax=Massariosphaeria phaeospora TaxID=100035 RepID=A0A7C8IGN9_9PLEO|nr:hypothetical protein BDV95DRAFT_601602 [Massariosphaeria phaeospora]
MPRNGTHDMSYALNKPKDYQSGLRKFEKLAEDEEFAARQSKNSAAAAKQSQVGATPEQKQHFLNHAVELVKDVETKLEQTRTALAGFDDTTDQNKVWRFKLKEKVLSTSAIKGAVEYHKQMKRGVATGLSLPDRLTFNMLYSEGRKHWLPLLEALRQKEDAEKEKKKDEEIEEETSGEEDNKDETEGETEGETEDDEDNKIGHEETGNEGDKKDETEEETKKADSKTDEKTSEPKAAVSVPNSKEETPKATPSKIPRPQQSMRKAKAVAQEAARLEQEAAGIRESTPELSTGTTALTPQIPETVTQTSSQATAVITNTPPAANHEETATATAPPTPQREIEGVTATATAEVATPQRPMKRKRVARPEDALIFRRPTKVRKVIPARAPALDHRPSGVSKLQDISQGTSSTTLASVPIIPKETAAVTDSSAPQHLVKAKVVKTTAATVSSTSPGTAGRKAKPASSGNGSPVARSSGDRKPAPTGSRPTGVQKQAPKKTFARKTSPTKRSSLVDQLLDEVNQL